MTLFDITQTDVIADAIDRLKGTTTPPDINALRKQYESVQHDTLDAIKRPDKPIKDNEGNIERHEKVNRLAFPLQKRIVGLTVAFTFGNPVNLLAKPADESEEMVLGAVNRILDDAKIDSVNRRVARELARSTQTAECWFSVEEKEVHDHYGFDTPFKVKVRVFSPWEGDVLFPYFDETDNLVAFSRAFSRSERVNGQTRTVQYFEVFTDEELALYKNDSGGGTNEGWVEVRKVPNPVNKIPVVFGQQELSEWHDVQCSIERLEYLLSNFADTNDYHGSPKIFVKGELLGFARKGESGAIIQGDQNATAEYLTWQHAPESVKLEIETLLRFIYTFTQTPDISFDSVKGLQEISGAALRMLFMDAHLKVQEKREIFDEYLQRRLNLLKAFVGTMNLQVKKQAARLQIKPQITPYMMDDLETTINTLMVANGGKPLISQRTAVERAGLVDDVETEYDQIQEEGERNRIGNVLDPVM